MHLMLANQLLVHFRNSSCHLLSGLNCSLATLSDVMLSLGAMLRTLSKSEASKVGRSSPFLALPRLRTVRYAW